MQSTSVWVASIFEAASTCAFAAIAAWEISTISPPDFSNFLEKLQLLVLQGYHFIGKDNCFLQPSAIACLPFVVPLESCYKKQNLNSSPFSLYRLGFQGHEEQHQRMQMDLGIFILSRAYSIIRCQELPP